MFMVIKEDIENLIFKCEKLIESNTMKDKRDKKELRTLKKVLKNYEVGEDNQIVFNEVDNRYTKLVFEIDNLKEENKFLKTVIRKLNTLLDSDNVITDDSEIGQLE